MVFAWKSGSRAKVSADIAGAICSQLEQEGRLTASELVEVSRPEDAPLHGEFEWHDHVAAEEWRKYQARNLISHLIVVSDDTATMPVRAFFNVSEERPQYDSFQTVVRDQDKYQQLKERAVKELIAIQNRYSMIEGLEGLSVIIEKLQAS